jgi:nicotinate phosphoribosyltransferase
LFGVGTELVTSRDEPTLSTVYKLVEQESSHGLVGRMKLSPDKKTYPFAKQIYRTIGEDGKFKYDIIARASSSSLAPGGRRDGGEGEDKREGEAPAEPLLTQVLNHGQLVGPLPSLEESRERCQQQLSRLPEELLDLDHHHTYSVCISPELER